jgi:hypothetical protein
MRPPLSSSFTLGDYRVFPPRERLFRRLYQLNVSTSKGVDPCFLRQQVVCLQRLVWGTQVFSGLSHSTPVSRLSFQTVKGYRSAISSTLHLLGSWGSNWDVAILSLIWNMALEHPLMRHSSPKWDFSVVLGALMGFPLSPRIR